MKKIYKILSHEAKEPKTFGWFHLISVTIIGFLTTILCKTAKSSTEKSERRVAFWVWIVLVTFEFYKQILYIFELKGNTFIIDYAWNAFPFQLCSMPLYILPFIAFLPSGKLREAFVAFFGTYVLLGGIAVCIYPGNVFVATLGINIQTMVWHGSQVFLGIYFNLRRFHSKNPPDLKKYFLSAIPIFLIAVSTAFTLNIVGHGMLNYFDIDGEINLFFISPYHDCMFPILKTIKLHTPYIVFLLSYIISLSVFSYAILSMEAVIIERIK